MILKNSRSSRALLAVFTTASLLGTAAVAAPGPVPSAAARKEAAELIREVYASELRAADEDPKKREALIRDLRRTAGDSATAASEKFALLDEARRQAIEGGSAQAAAEIVAELDEHFKINLLSVSAVTLEKLSDNARSAEAKEEAATVLIELLERAVTATDMKSAERLLKTAEKVTQRPTTDSLRTSRRTVLERQRQLEPVFAKWQRVSAALKTLTEKPLDAEANKIAGSFYCFDCQNVKRGLPHLALSGDAALVKIAQAELARPQDADGQAKLAADWHALAETLTEAQKPVALRRASELYSQALPDMKGLDKLKAEKVIAEIKAALPEQVAGSATGSSKKTTKRKEKKKLAPIVVARDAHIGMISRRMRTPTSASSSSRRSRYEMRSLKPVPIARSLISFTAVATGNCAGVVRVYTGSRSFEAGAWTSSQVRGRPLTFSLALMSGLSGTETTTRMDVYFDIKQGAGRLDIRQVVWAFDPNEPEKLAGLDGNSNGGNSGDNDNDGNNSNFEFTKPSVPEPAPETTNPFDGAKTVDFKRWSYAGDESGRSGVFVKQRDGTWVEFKDAKVWAKFKEVTRTAEYVELHDENRGIWVRLHRDSGAWSRNRTRWTTFGNGKPG